MDEFIITKLDSALPDPQETGSIPPALPVAATPTELTPKFIILVIGIILLITLLIIVASQTLALPTK